MDRPPKLDENHSGQIKMIVDFIVDNGTTNTTSGNYITYFDTLPPEVAGNDFMKENAEAILAELLSREEVLNVELEDAAFNVIYGLDYCPYCDELDDNSTEHEHSDEATLPHEIPKMNKERFWNMIGFANERSSNRDEMFIRLHSLLCSLEPKEIVHWYRIYDEYLGLADKGKIVSAAVYINGGISDDSFIDFRAWLIAQGKKAYHNALADPDSLADTKAIQDFAAEVNSNDFQPENGYVHKPLFEQMSYVAAIAYEEKQGIESDFYDRFNQGALSEKEKANIQNEIHYAKDIDVMPDADTPLLEALARLEEMFPKLTAVLEPENTNEKPSITTQIKAVKKATASNEKRKKPPKQSGDMEV